MRSEHGRIQHVWRLVVCCFQFFRLVPKCNFVTSRKMSQKTQETSLMRSLSLYFGLIVPDNDAHAYAAALLRLIENPDLRATLGAKARETILEKHNPENVARQLESIALAAYDPYKTIV